MGGRPGFDTSMDSVETEPLYGPRIAAVKVATKRWTWLLFGWLTAISLLVVASLLLVASLLVPRVSEVWFNALLLAAFGWAAFVLFIVVAWTVHLLLTEYLHRKFVTRRFKEKS